MIKEIKVYTELSIDDIDKFEESLIRWSEIEGPKSSMIFQQNSLDAIDRKLKEQFHGQSYGVFLANENSGIGNLDTPNLRVQWDNLGIDKCIIKNIVFKPERRKIYSATECWEGNQLWYGC